MKVKKSCADTSSRACASNDLHIVGALAGLGEYLTGAVGHCSHKATLANCGSEISSLIHHLTKVAATGEDISKHCAHKEPAAAPTVVTEEIPVEIRTGRLYAEGDTAQTAAVSPNMLL